VLEEDFPDAEEEPVYAAGGDKPVGKPRDTGRRNGASGKKGFPGGGTERPEHPFEKRKDLAHIAEGEGGRNERGDFRVRAVREPAGEPDGIGGRIRVPVREKRRLERPPEKPGSRYGITLLSGYSTIPEAPDIFSTGISSRTVFSSTMTSRLNHPSSESDDTVGF